MRRQGSIFIGAATGLALLSGCGEKAHDEKPPTPVRVQALAPAAGGAGVRYSASLSPREQVNLSFKVSGYLREILQVRGIDGRPRDVQEGDRVERGTVLARVREDDYTERVNQARSQVVEAQASNLQAKQDFDRAQALYNTQSMTKTDYDAAQARFDVTQARVDGAKAQFVQAQVALGDCALTTPITGVVLSANVKAGELAVPGTVGFVVADTTWVKAVFGVSDIMLPDLKPGGALSVRTEALPEVELHGRITRIAPSADPKSRVFEVELSIPNPDGRLKPGMISALQAGETAPAPGAAAESPVAVRLSAIVRPPAEPEGYAVYVVQEENGRPVARLRKVTLGEALGNSIAVSGGLKTGERVIVTGATLVNDGEPVRVVP
ncbi:MAG TPA: efflux RND transporter periplasmic adaptor subunit [Candidatus Polarisedimenticolia bacterium]|nr:efflux RND transporter periplasmic adaptor subunit [Candidatus Polarisedimenticolia bacterium]